MTHTTKADAFFGLIAEILATGVGASSNWFHHFCGAHCAHPGGRRLDQPGAELRARACAQRFTHLEGYGEHLDGPFPYLREYFIGELFAAALVEDGRR